VCVCVCVCLAGKEDVQRWWG